ncbi:MAG: radical SAM protein [bacterium]
MNSAKNLKYSKINKVYIEEDLLDNNYTKEILEKLNKPQIIKIKHYKDVFNRRNQSHRFQKENLTIILAKSNEKKVYKGSQICNDFGYDDFYYVVNQMNCTFDCEYCFLKGMYPSSNIVIFVDYEDIMLEVNKKIKGEGYISLSYEGDLLALEKIHNLNKKWMEFARKNPDIKFESRTKSSDFSAIKAENPPDNFILSWTLSPQAIIEKYEKYSPSLDKRIESINEALKKGWKVRIFIEPVLRVENGVNIYMRMFCYLKEKIDLKKIDEINLDFFRINKNYFKALKNIYSDSILYAYPFKNNKGILEYKEDYKKEILKGFKKIITD